MKIFPKKGACVGRTIFWGRQNGKKKPQPTQKLVGASTGASLQRTIPTSNNHQAMATKIITVISFGVGEGITSSSHYFHVGNKDPT